jgi:hypothetical protein
VHGHLQRVKDAQRLSIGLRIDSDRVGLKRELLGRAQVSPMRIIAALASSLIAGFTGSAARTMELGEASVAPTRRPIKAAPVLLNFHIVCAPPYKPYRHGGWIFSDRAIAAYAELAKM